MRSRLLRSLLVVLGAAAGAALALLFDPASGRRRRHALLDRTRARARRTFRRGRRFVHHAGSDAYGLAQRIVHRVRDEPRELDDVTLAHKVESVLFRDPAVPKGQININAEYGVVYLRGELDRQDLIEALENEVRKVKGVCGVENLLHLSGSQPPQRR